jgi:hypothetical protein
MEKSLLLETYLKQLRLPAICRHYQELARQAVQRNLPYEAFLLALVEMEAQQREENAHQKRLRQAKFPVIKSLDQFDFTAIPSLNKARILDLAQGLIRSTLEKTVENQMILAKLHSIETSLNELRIEGFNQRAQAEDQTHLFSLRKKWDKPQSKWDIN